MIRDNDFLLLENICYFLILENHFLISEIHFLIFTMVSYFILWTLLKLYDSFPDKYSHQVVPVVGQITRAVIKLWEFWIYNVYRRILGRVFVGNIVNIRNECLFSGFMGNESERGTNKSSENRFTVHAICLSCTLIHSPWIQKKDTHSLNIIKSFCHFRK